MTWDELRAENARLREAQAWQPIETAPKDGTEILGFWQYVYPDDEARTFGYSVIQWIALRGCWVDEAGDTTDLFTHWMPLPEAPKETGK